jgi:DNA-binding GntR family transcriptional regulator
MLETAQESGAASRAVPRQIALALEEDIVLGRLYPRERLLEERLARRFGVNRHHVREALIDLEHRGLIERQRNRGAMVRELTAQDATKLYEVREALEVTAAAILPFPAAPEVLDELERIQGAHARAVAEGEARVVFQRNIEFHRVLFGACGNPYLDEAIQQLAQRSHATRAYTMHDPAHLQASGEEHWAMIEAVREERREDLVELCRNHLRRGRDAYVAAYHARHNLR